MPAVQQIYFELGDLVLKNTIEEGNELLEELKANAEKMRQHLNTLQREIERQKQEATCYRQFLLSIGFNQKQLSDLLAEFRDTKF